MSARSSRLPPEVAVLDRQRAARISPVRVGAFGYWLFDEPVDRYTLLGASIIFASTIYIAHRETRLAKPTITDPLIQSETQQR